MGAWGYGPLDNDAALDALAMHSDSLIRLAQHALGDARSKFAPSAFDRGIALLWMADRLQEPGPYSKELAELAEQYRAQFHADHNATHYEDVAQRVQCMTAFFDGIAARYAASQKTAEDRR